MHIVDIRCLNGPNYWSVRHSKLVMMNVDLEQLEDFPTHRIRGFYERLQDLLPGLFNHPCSEDDPGRFMDRVKKGTRLSHVLEHVAVEIQTLAGMAVGFSQTRETTKPGVYTIVVACQEEPIGIHAAHCALAITEALVSGCGYDLEKTVRELRRINEMNRLEPGMAAIVEACARRGIPHIRLASESCVQLGYGAAQQRIMQAFSSRGNLRDMGEAIAERLFPNKASGRIPIIAVTGTNGKTTTTRLLAHLYKQTGRCVGYTTTDGIYTDNQCIETGDCTGPLSSRKVLCNPAVEVAVLECARGGLLRSGLAFDQCDIGIVTNVAEDHIGLGDVHSLTDLARLKAVVPASVRPGGYAILNADNDYTYAMRERVPGSVALFSRQPWSERIQAHGEAGGLAAVYDADGFITVLRGTKSTRIEHVQHIPLTFGGKCPFMIDNVLAATLAAYCQGLAVGDIVRGLQTFEPSGDTTPGRMNLFTFSNFSVLIDYAHNPHGLAALGEYVGQVEATQRVGILTGVGDRRDEDLVQLGRVAAHIFDEVIIRLDKDFRGRNPLALVELVRQGILAVDSQKPITVIRDELAALTHAIQTVRPGALIVHLTEQVEQTIKFVESYKSHDAHYGVYAGVPEPV